MLCSQRRVHAAGFGSLLLQWAAGWGHWLCGSRAPVTPVLLEPQSCRDPSLARRGWSCGEAPGRLQGGSCPAPVCSLYLGGERGFCSAAARSRWGDTVCLGSAVFHFGKQSLLGIPAPLVSVQLGLKPDLEGTPFPAARMLLAPSAAAFAEAELRLCCGTAVPALRVSQDSGGSLHAARVPFISLRRVLSERGGTREKLGSPFQQILWLYFSEHCPGSVCHSVYECNLSPHEAINRCNNVY